MLPPGADNADEPARRQSPRLKVDGQLRTRIVTLDLDVEIRDIGFDGFLVAAPVDIATGEVHVFEVTPNTGEVRTIRARAVHCHAPRGDDTVFLSGWRCGVDETTQTSMAHVLASVATSAEDLEDPAVRQPQKTTPAWEFVITTLDEAHVVGHGLVCPEARYASVKWIVAAEIVRGYGGGAIWRTIEAELEGMQLAGVLPAESLTSALLLPDSLRGSCALRVEDRPAFRERRGNALVGALDAYLWTAPRQIALVR